MDSVSTLTDKNNTLLKMIMSDCLTVLRIQVPEADFERILDMRTELVEKLKSIAFRFNMLLTLSTTVENNNNLD